MVTVCQEQLIADLLPDPEQGKLFVALHGMTTPRDNRALAALCVGINDLEVCYPGTDLKLVFKATQTQSESR